MAMGQLDFFGLLSDLGFTGNVSEGQTLAGMREGLHASAGALVVMDRGIATEANLLWLREQGYRYLVVSRERSRQFDPA